MAFWHRIFLSGRRLLRPDIFFVFLLVTSLSLMGYMLFYAQHKRSLDFHNSFMDISGVIPSTAGNFTDDKSFGAMTVHTWSDICGTSVDVLRTWPHFPFYPDNRSVIPKFHHIRDLIQSSGERVFGFLQPQRSGGYKFAITASGPSELWLSLNEEPNASKMIARVYSPTQSAWTLEGDFTKYSDQMSKEFILDAGKKYYIESLSMRHVPKQGSGDSHIAVYWLYGKNTTFEIISSKYLSTFFKDSNSESIIPSHAGKQNVLHQSRVNLYYFHRLPFMVNKTEYTTLIPTCSYSPSFLVRRKIKRYSGVWMTKESSVFPQDDTNMFNNADPNKWQKWSVPNPIVDKNRVEYVVDKFMTILRSRNYFLKKIHKVIQKPDPKNGDRFLLDLELGMKNSSQTFRLTEHVYQKKGSENLCLPEGMNWNNSATVYFIVPVKDQGKWIHHFIKQVTEASLLTGDTNFHVIIADFESKDIDMGKAFNTTLLSRRHTIINMAGKFYKTLALNKAAEAVPNAHDIIFLFDLHIDVPADIMDSVRKNTIANRMVYFPVVGRLDCGSTPADHIGFWQLDGFGIMAMYKSDWDRLGGMNIKDYQFKWGGEDWDLIDRVLMMAFEVERIKYPGMYHHHHSRRAMWN